MTRKRILMHIALIILGIVVFGVSLSLYKEAETHLTPASVSVSGYTRRDGTYVRPYNRRPPGGAIHDRPYENAMFFYSILMVLGGGLVIIPIGMMIHAKTQTLNQEREKRRRLLEEELCEAERKLEEYLDEEASKEAAEEAFRKMKEEVEAEAKLNGPVSKEDLDKEYEELIDKFKKVAKKTKKQ